MRSFVSRLARLSAPCAAIFLTASIALDDPAGAENSQLPEKLSGHGGPVRSVSVSADGERALSASFDYSIIYWSLKGEEGTVIKRLIGHNAAVNDVEFVPADGRETLAVSVGDDGAFAIWDLSAGEPVSIINDTADKVLDVAVSPDGKLAAAARWDATARVYDIAKAEEIYRLEGHRNNINAVVFGADSSFLLTGSYDGDIRYWQLAGNGENQHSFQNGSVIHANGWGINALERIGDTDRVVFGAIDGGVGVLDIATGEVKTAGNFEHPVLRISVDPQAEYFATGSGDGFLRVYDAETLDIIESWQNPYGPVWGLAFSADGRRLYKTGLDDFVGYWQVNPRKPFDQPQGDLPRRFQVQASMNPGELEFQRKCSICHTLTPDDANRAGPTLYGLFGRKAGTVEGYPYSDALKDSDIVWNAETIGQLFDHGPDVVTPGTKMPIQRLKSVERRDALIAFLEKATALGGN